MDKQQLLEKIKGGNYSKEQLLAWVNCLPTTTSTRKPLEYKVGDVFMHHVFKHPYILLKKRKNDWLCGLFTSEENFPDILEPCKSRFFDKEFFVKSLFTAKEVEGSFINSYDNHKHLREILIKLQKELI